MSRTILNGGMPSESADTKRTLMGLVAFVTGGAVPIQLVTLSFGYAQYVRGVPKGPEAIQLAHQVAEWYLPFVYIPALVLLFGIAAYTRRRYAGLSRRIFVGFGMGAVATLALDAVRQMGVIHGWLPGDTPVLFGRMATGSSAFAVLWPVGLIVHYLIVHYLNGANFGLIYAFVWGKRASYRSAALWATAWALLVELGMMTLPPMGPMTGLFGSQHAWPQLFLITLVAHVFFGVALGLLVQHFLREEDRAWLIPFLRGGGAGRP